MYFIPTSALPFASLRRIFRSSVLLLSLGVLAPTPAYSESAPRIPAPAVDAPVVAVEGFQTAVLAGGCFWGIQAVFQHVKGVSGAVSGYAGGSKATAVYDIVSSGWSGHAEVVQIKFDPRQISYGKVLQVFFSVAHDPTELNRQGPDVGTQYRSVIFYQDDTQRRVAESYIAQLNKTGAFKRPIVTKLDPLVAFYPAEDYHQDYVTKHPNQSYIVSNDRPKVENLKRLFPDIYRETPVLVTAGETRR